MGATSIDLNQNELGGSFYLIRLKFEDKKGPWNGDPKPDLFHLLSLGPILQREHSIKYVCYQRKGLSLAINQSKKS